MQEIAVVLLVGFTVYFSFYNGLHNAFTFDDHLAIDGNHDVTGSSFDPFLWFHDIWGKDLVEHDSHKSYRPLLIIIFRFLWHYENQAFIFRFVSIFLHFFTSCLVYLLAKWTFRNNPDCFSIALGSSLLFASHPIHVESVTAVVNLAEPASAILIIISYLLFQRIHLSFLSMNSGTFLNLLQVILYGGLVVVAILLKETGIITLLLCLASTGMNSLYLLLQTLYVSRKVYQNGHIKRYYQTMTYRSSKILMTATTLVLIIVFFIYSYFVFREIITSHDRLEILLHPRKFIVFFSTYLFRRNGTASYLNASELIRRAENPFAFITGTERVLSYLVRICFLL